MTDSGKKAYQVLARKYRPSNFDELIGQGAMVRTLSNAIESGRLAHAFVLTGVRGVGKTTTARIIARALNCTGEDGQGGATINPCGVCENCRAIAEDRHVDIIEMDAASHTGVDDIREIIDAVRYAPVSARYKIYIIDEVHMLSRSAFNALLKTLEEPPGHTKFIFATTEIRKVPVTVLSRCQRFDLRRIETEELTDHLQNIVGQEESEADRGALAMIARASEGSVRDSLSMLDQALAHGNGKVDEVQVRDMLGLADRTRVLELFDRTMAGKADEALEALAEQYTMGADPIVVLQDMLELSHWLTRVKVVPKTAEDPSVPEEERTKGKEICGRLGMAALTRAWQILLKGLQEAQMAPSPLAAAEMTLVRLAYVADLPSPGELVKKLEGATTGAAAPQGSSQGGGPGGGGAHAQVQASAPVMTNAVSAASMAPNGSTGAMAQAMPMATPMTDAQPKVTLRSFDAVVRFAEQQKESKLKVELEDFVHLVSFGPRRMELRLEPEAPRDLTTRLMEFLRRETGEAWVISIAGDGGDVTLSEKKQAARDSLWAEVSEHPSIAAVFKLFPDAVMIDVRESDLFGAGGDMADGAVDIEYFEDDELL